MDHSILAQPRRGLVLFDCEDPSGNGQPTAELGYIDDAGFEFHAGVYVGVHGGGPMNFRVLHGNPSPSDTVGEVFELGNDHRVVISAL